MSSAVNDYRLKLSVYSRGESMENAGTPDQVGVRVERAAGLVSRMAVEAKEARGLLVR